jgi:hypothetical protein
MPDEFTSWRRTNDRSPDRDRFVTKARHIHRFGRPQRVNQARREAERDRVIFLWVMAGLVAIGIVVAFAVLVINKDASGGGAG